MRHLDETELMMLHYDPDGSEAEQQHVETCDTCRASFEELSKALISDAKNRQDITTGYPDSFWERQRTAILRRATQEKDRRKTQSILWRGFVAAMFVVVIALFVTRNFKETPTGSAHPAAVAAAPAVAPASPAPTDRVASLDEVPADPWESDELQSFHQVVQWETWEPKPQPPRKGGTS